MLVAVFAIHLSLCDLPQLRSETENSGKVVGIHFEESISSGQQLLDLSPFPGTRIPRLSPNQMNSNEISSPASDTTNTKFGH